MLLVVSGFDPSAGAGIFQDVKILALLGIKAEGVIGAYTIQNNQKVFDVKYVDFDTIEKQLEVLGVPKVIKVGLVSPTVVGKLRKKYPNAFIVWNVILESSSGYKFQDEREVLENLHYADLITLNSDEVQKLSRFSEKLPAEKFVITGGHRKEEDIVVRYKDNKFFGKRYPGTFHGTGCSFSSALAGYIYLGYSVESAIESAMGLLGQIIERSVSKEYVATELLVREWQKYFVLEELNKILPELLELSHLTVPEVGQNISFALDWSQKETEVAKFPGRIRLCKGKGIVVSSASFEDNSHTARMVLTAKIFDKSIKCAANVRYKPEYVEKAQKCGLKTFKYDRSLEDEKLYNSPVGSMEKMIELAFNELGCIPDIIWDDGWFGKEAMIRVFGKNPRDVVEKIKKTVL